MDLRELPGLAEDYPAYQELKKGGRRRRRHTA